MSSQVNLQLRPNFTPFRSNHIQSKDPRRFSGRPDGQRRFEAWGEDTIREGVRLIQIGVQKGCDLRQLFARVSSHAATERGHHARENGTPQAEIFGRRRGSPVKGETFSTRLTGIYGDCGAEFVGRITAECPGLKPGRSVTITDREPEYSSTISIQVMSRASYKKRYPFVTLAELRRYVSSTVIESALKRYASEGGKPFTDAEIVAILMSDDACIMSLPAQTRFNHAAARRLRIFEDQNPEAAALEDLVVVVRKEIGKRSVCYPLADYIISWPPKDPVIFHTDEVDIRYLDRMLEELFCEILAWHQGLSLEALIDKVGLFRYIQGNAAMDGRGSATTAEILEGIFYRYHWIDCQTAPGDLWAIGALTPGSFLIEYRSRLQLNADVPVAVSLRPEYIAPTVWLSPSDLEEGLKQASELTHPTLASVWNIFASLRITRLRTDTLMGRLPETDPAVLLSNTRRVVPDLMDPTKQRHTYGTKVNGYQQMITVEKPSETDPLYQSIAPHFPIEKLENGRLFSITKEISIGERSYTLLRSYICVPNERSEFSNAIGVIEYAPPEAIQPIMDALEIHFQKALSWDPTTSIRNLKEEIATILYFLTHLAPHASVSHDIAKCIEHFLYRFYNMDCPTDYTARCALFSPNTEVFYPYYREQWQ